MSSSAAQRQADLTSIKSNMMPPSKQKIPIVDSHIHLYPEAELSTLAWLDPSCPRELQGQHSVEDWKHAIGEAPEVEGFVFLETDRKFDLEKGVEDGSGWDGPLMEVAWLARIAQGNPRSGEGHTPEDARLCLGIVPWAPLPSGEARMSVYLDRVKAIAGASFDQICGFRYLTQDKDKATMVAPAFNESLKWMGRKGYVFDHGIDHHRTGEWQLDETVEMIRSAHESVPDHEKVGFVLNMTLSPASEITTDSKFIAWREAIFTLSTFSKTYMKLSGCFSEIPETLQNESADVIFEAIFPWLAVILAAFKPQRIMFGSDWPVCSAGIGDGAWRKWREVVERMCEMAALNVEDQIMIWSGTAIRAYGIKAPT